MDNNPTFLENMEINTFKYKTAKRSMRATEKPSKKASQLKLGMITLKSLIFQEKKSLVDSKTTKESIQ